MDQKIVCSSCKHWQVFDEESINHFNKNPEEYDCELCHFNQPGHPKFVGNYFACGFCNQVSRNDSCDCEEALEANMSTIKLVFDPDSKWLRKNKVNEKEEEGKTNREFNKIVRNKKVEAEERQIKIEKHLERIVELMEAKVGV